MSATDYDNVDAFGPDAIKCSCTFNSTEGFNAVQCAGPQATPTVLFARITASGSTIRLLLSYYLHVQLLLF